MCRFFKGGTKHEHRNGYWSFINVRLLIIFMFHGLIFLFCNMYPTKPSKACYIQSFGGFLFFFTLQCIVMHEHSWLVGTNIILIILGGVLSKFMVAFKR